MSLFLPLLLLLVAVAATPALTAALRRNAGYPLALAYLAAAALFAPAAAEVMAGGHPQWSVPWVPALGVDLALRADGLGVVFTLIALLVGAAVLTYAARYLSAGPNHRGFYLVMATFTAAMLGLVLADDVVLLFICWELTSLASFFLIAQGGRGGELASMRTLLLTFVGGLSLLIAVGVLVAVTGTTRLSEALVHPVWTSEPGVTTLVAVLVLIAGFSKSAQFPFHVWLPDAMAASTPVSAYLHAAAVVKAGIFLLLRFSPAFHATPVWNAALITVGLFTAALGAWFALGQHDLKKLMAYSTVSQLGLIVATIGVGTEAALAAAVVHTIAHALFKSGLFMMVGVVDHAAHTRDLRRLPALRHQLPVSFAVTLLGAASMAGVPPLLGFVSKESLLGALHGSPGGAVAGWAALAGAAAASVLTFLYCAKIAVGTFVDTGAEVPHEREIHRPDVLLLLPAALPILASVPLGLVPGLLDATVDRAVEAVLPHARPHTHLALWHGLTPELVATLLVFALGTALVVARGRVLPALERPMLPFDGPLALATGSRGVQRVGGVIARLVAADYPSRHLAAIVGAFVALSVPGLFLLTRDGLPAPVPHLSRPVDAVLFVLIAAAVVSVCASGSRLAATVSLSAVGILATVQILALGAPDVGLTQLLVESLTVIVIMLVLQKLPLRFGRTAPSRRMGTGALAVAAGLAAGGLTWALAGRRPRSDVAEYLLAEGSEVTGGANIVNVILVEFRALDTLGELAVLGMAGVAIVAVLSTVRSRHLDPHPPSEGTDHGEPYHDPGTIPPPELDLRPEGSTAARAIGEAWGNAVALQLMLRVLGPLLIAVSALIFWRGHNSPGGGFIAALVAAAIVGLVYLSTSRDRQIGPPRLPLLLIGGGVTIAVLTGLWGLLARGSFLLPLHGYAGDVHLTTSMLFDVGVYAAVLGLIMVAFNLLGTSPDGVGPGGEETRERVDEAVEGELPGPLETVRGEHPGEAPRTSRPRVGATTRFLAADTPPRELGRPPAGGATSSAEPATDDPKEVGP